MDKYEELKKQVELEAKFAIDFVRGHHPGCCIPDDSEGLISFIGGGEGNLDGFERGMLFAYMSIKHKIDSLEEGPT